MQKFKFHAGDLVKAVGDPAKPPVIGKVFSLSCGGGHKWYKVLSKGDVYNCEENELELMRSSKRCFADQYTLEWYRPEDMMPEDVVPGEWMSDTKYLIITVEDELERHPAVTAVHYMTGGEDVPAAFLTPPGAGEPRAYTMDEVLLWSTWEWPEYPDSVEIKSEGGEDDDGDSDD